MNSFALNPQGAVGIVEAQPKTAQGEHDAVTDEPYHGTQEQAEGLHTGQGPRHGQHDGDGAQHWMKG